MKTWYTIAAKGDKSAEITIFDEIGFWGVTAAMFIADLKKLGEVDNLNVLINSPGGSVFDGLAIYNSLRQHPATVNVKVMGIAASAASFIAMAGDTIEMPENAFMMVHNPMGGVFGNADEMREWADTLDKIAASLIGIYVKRTGKTETEVKALLDAETWMTAKEAVDLGFADKVTEDMRVAAVFETDRLPANVRTAFKAPEPPEAAMAEQIGALAEKAGLGSFADIFSLRNDSLAKAEADIKRTREVMALCKVAKAEDKADGFVRNPIPLAEVRKQLIEARAAEDEKLPIDTTPKTPESKPPVKSQAPLSTSAVWAARRNNSR